MNAKKSIIQFAILLIIGIIVSDFSYTAVQYTHNESTGFIIETDFEASDDYLIGSMTPFLKDAFVLLFAATYPQSTPVLQPGASNLSPHGWRVPVYLDDCVFLI